MKDLSITILYDCYSGLLSEKQRTVFELYYDEDLSLSEIAEHTGTTRQGVRDLLKRSEEQLKFFEDTLSLCEKNKLLENLLLKYNNDTFIKETVEKILSK
ncbi:MAG: DNA-binding protein [Clostridia bacterium]|nr:DNA-binding protein [Clostridia bacterium]